MLEEELAEERKKKEELEGQLKVVQERVASGDVDVDVDVDVEDEPESEVGDNDDDDFAVEEILKDKQISSGAISPHKRNLLRRLYQNLRTNPHDKQLVTDVELLKSKLKKENDNIIRSKESDQQVS